jgi:hypothetical protein
LVVFVIVERNGVGRDCGGEGIFIPRQRRKLERGGHGNSFDDMRAVSR